MWYFTMQKVSDSRPGLLVCATEAEAITQKAQLVSDFPDAVFGDIFEASGEYYCTFPHVIGECTNADGSLDLLWSDGVRTPKPAKETTMAIPACTAGADQSFAYSVSQAVTLAGAATGSPTAWEWRMLSVPSGSTDNVGTNGSFTNGVATVQNPSFTAHNPGCYVLQLKAQNGDGWSDPLIDKENGQTLVFIRTQKLNLEIPNFQAYRYDTSLLAALLLLEASSGSGTDADAIHDNVASEIVFITAKVTPNAEDIVVIEDKDDSFNKKKMFVSNLPMGSDRWLQRSSDTEYTETTETFTLKATFRVARNAGRKPIAWGVAVSAWSEVASGGKPEIRVDAVGSGGTDSVTLYTDQGMTETVYQSSFLITDAYEPTDDPVTINVYLRTTVAGDDAYMKLFELYAIVDTTGGLHGGGGGGG